MPKKEARLLHFSRTDKSPTDPFFKLSHPTAKGFPIDIPLERTYTEAKMLSEQYESGLMEAITEIVGEGGVMDGWFVNWDGVRNVNVIVVRETVEGEWIPTPCSSVADDVMEGGA
ncbi:MAG: hypothetical protein LQ349_002969 [Xanthoria aureola]|nr:MAG: hypothetical protein LQ349_002969 [Xanthoria aureola]